MSTPNKLTLAAIAFLILVVVCGTLGMCGKPSDHGPKPAPSSSVVKPSPSKK